MWVTAWTLAQKCSTRWMSGLWSITPAPGDRSKNVHPVIAEIWSSEIIVAVDWRNVINCGISTQATDRGAAGRSWLEDRKLLGNPITCRRKAVTGWLFAALDTSLRLHYASPARAQSFSSLGSSFNPLPTPLHSVHLGCQATKPHSTKANSNWLVLQSVPPLHAATAQLSLTLTLHTHSLALCLSLTGC